MHTETGRECHNGRDDDHDGLPDCKDPDCASVCKSGGSHGRERGRQCYDGKDNDGDGKVSVFCPICLCFYRSTFCDFDSRHDFVS